MMDQARFAAQKAKQQQDPAPISSVGEGPILVTDSASLWAELAPFQVDPRQMRKYRIVTFARSDPAYVTFDTMRTKIAQVLREKNWTSIALTSPTPDCGKSMICLNLAFSFARQKGCRTVLVDLDLRRPRIAELLGLPGTSSVEKFLRRESGIEVVFGRYGDSLAVGLGHRASPDSAELLQSADTAQALRDLRQRLKPDVTIYDLPPMLVSDDALGFLPNVDCVMLVVAAEANTINEIDICKRDLTERTNLLGVVLNKCRFFQETYGYYS